MLSKVHSDELFRFTEALPLLRLEERIEISSSPDAVWQVLRNFGSAALWAPGVVTSLSNGDRTAETGARRVLRHLWGFQLEEVVTAWDEGRGYSFIVVKAPFPLRNVRETWAIDTGSRDARVSTAVEYEMGLGPIGNITDRVLMRHLIRREMRLGLAGLKRYVESMTPAGPG